MTNVPGIRDLAIIGDRRTAAIVARDGAIVWYCPQRFDYPSLFAALLDARKGGSWAIDLPPGHGKTRRYIEESGILETRIETANGDEFTITDWMPVGEGMPTGICRLFSTAPVPLSVTISPAPDYGGSSLDLQRHDQAVSINNRHWLYCSHPLSVETGRIRFELAAGEAGWAVLADAPIPLPDDIDLQAWLRTSLDHWRGLAADIRYSGPFEHEVSQSLRALRLLTFEQHGGVIAAATTSLPEVLQGERNYDYRYVWMRDTGMIVSALVRAGSQGADARKFLEFVCGSKQTEPGKPMLPPFLSLDYRPAPDESHLDFAGYQDSRPVRIGNNANRQLQLDGFANVLLAAKLIYGRYGTREHWNTVAQIADYLVDHWQEPDNGIWEEHCARQYTMGKVITSCALRYIADYAENEMQARRWRHAVHDIEEYVARCCITSEGAYAVFAGSDAVDISAALFPVWGYTAADTPEMLATMHVLERDYSQGQLYWRHLEEAEPGREGAFLAGTIWVAQYWVMRKDLERARHILETALAYANDLGLFAEEADPATGNMLGNFPQTFVHAAFVGAVHDFKQALEDTG